ncbi:unnamed protein product [Gongylonema pulchrum]|uniref:Uncharacterized protein n=1 Tax=Gongylonema pulchrum TaxID=637853 RepID=A0A183D7E4_9BILA|nr:unnamed protein product [Gongylonema pulchrum]
MWKSKWQEKLERNSGKLIRKELKQLHQKVNQKRSMEASGIKKQVQRRSRSTGEWSRTKVR